MSLLVSIMLQQRRDVQQQSILFMFHSSSSIYDNTRKSMPHHSISLGISIHFHIEGFLINGDNVYEKHVKTYGSGKDDGQESMHENLKIKGSDKEAKDG